MKFKLLIIFCFFLSSNALAKSKALIIANENYNYKFPLRTPVNDIKFIKRKLEILNFRVTARKNLNKTQILNAISRFSNSLESGDIALFYFSGRGFVANNSDYLLSLKKSTVNGMSRSSVPVSYIVQELEKKQLGLNLVIIDTSRVALKNRRFFGEPSLVTSSIVNGNTVVAFSTSQNEPSFNRTTHLSIYTKLLLKNFARATQDITTVTQILNRVNNAVFRQTQGLQHPIKYGGHDKESFNNLIGNPRILRAWPNVRKQKMPTLITEKGLDVVHIPHSPFVTKLSTSEEEQLILMEKIHQQLNLANIEFKVPETMNINDSKTIILSLGMKGVLIALHDFKDEGMKIYKHNDIYVSDRIQSHLVGANFDVKVITPEIQAVPMNKNVVWKWVIKPLKAGEQHLSLTISALIPIQGESTPVKYKSLDKTILIKVTAFQTLSQIIEKNSELFITTIFSVIAFLLMFGRKMVKAKLKT